MEREVGVDGVSGADSLLGRAERRRNARERWCKQDARRGRRTRGGGRRNAAATVQSRGAGAAWASDRKSRRAIQQRSVGG